MSSTAMHPSLKNKYPSAQEQNASASPAVRVSASRLKKVSAISRETWRGYFLDGAVVHPGRPWHAHVKRLIDFVAACFFLIVLAPLLVIVALAIKLTSRGPVLYWQWRVGQGGREFRFPKFRSMVNDAEAQQTRLLRENDHGNSVTFKMKADPRVTRIGRLIRRCSIDEL